MEIYFLDVGQGTCQVILLGARQAIVIDCGTSKDRIVLHFLHRMGIDHIVRLVVSHTHEDHCGAAVAILGEYQNLIGQICFVQDDQFLESPFWLRISELLRAEILKKNQLVRLEVAEGPQLIWQDRSLHARLRTFSPLAAENLLAQAASQQNPTSAVLFLNIGSRQVIFAADSEIAQWREIRRRAGRRQSCDILAVPHHGGLIGGTEQELVWLLDEAIHANVAVVSVGTSNTHHHPRPEVIHAITARGIRVMCTQITLKCNDDLETLRPGVLQPITAFGRSSPTRDLTQRGNSRNVACAGTVRAIFSIDNLHIDRFRDHQLAIHAMAASASAHPLCQL
jgi:beta-lactamase superfamily II metal-dependent hydrolase